MSKYFIKKKGIPIPNLTYFQKNHLSSIFESICVLKTIFINSCFKN